MGIYEKRALIEQNFFQKLFKKYPKQNYMAELENLFCDNEGKITSVDISEVKALKTKYKIKNKDFQIERKSLLDRYISYCLWDERLSDVEKQQLSYVATLLDISEDYLKKRIAEEGEIIYTKKVKLVISDDKIEDSEESELNTLEKEFHLSESDATKILKDEVNTKIQSYVDQLIEKRRISPEEEKKFHEMVSGMHVKVEITGDGLSRFRKYWDIENKELNPMNSPINLQKSENLYFTANVEWYEERTRTTTVSYGGVGTRFKICKGVYLRAGSIAPMRNTETYLKLIDRGDVFFTNKRIIFMGDHGNKVIPYSKILSFTPYSNGIEIDKETGKKPFLKYVDDTELMSIYLARLLKDY